MFKDFHLQGRQRSVLLISFLLLAVASFAVPAKPGLTRLLTLIGGKTVNATLVGDEYLHYWLGEDGKAYQAVSQQDRGSKGGSEDGDAVYQTFDVEAAKKSADERRSSANQRRARRLAPRKAGIGEVGNISGTKKGLIILVNFQDVVFQSANNSALYQRIANEKNFSYTINSDYSFKGSMYDYFYDQSDGLFELTFDVVGPYTVSHDCSYYGNNQNNKQGDDAHPAEMVIEALQLANPDVDFSDYDWDNDLIVEQVYVIYAGKGEADGGAASTIWPHEWTLASAKYYGDGAGSQTLDGVTIDTYACGGELIGNEETPTIAGIGTMCHEFSHCLGYPDFYDTDYSGGQGMGYWDLMCSGSYNDDGYQPAGYTSYERWVAGWKTPTELEYTQNISNMAALQTTGSDSYIIYNKGNDSEYYLLENRQKTGWDASLPGAGLLILHVDYDEEAWSNNQPNDDPDHQRMTWIAADNNYQYTMSNGTKYYTFSGMKNDPFPYGSVNAFSKNTTPAATLYNKNSDNTYYLDSSIENITQNSDGTISFNFRGISNVALPNLSPEGGRFTNDQTVTVTITAETGATIYYTTNGNTPTTASTLYTAPFTLNATTTVKAIAVKNDEESDVATATYTFVNPLIMADESLSFSVDVGSSDTEQLTVLTEGLTEDVTLTLTDANNVFTLGTNTISKSLEEATVDVTFSPTSAGNYSGTITLSSVGADPVTVPLSATATLPVPTTPTGLTLSEETATSFTASWSAVTLAESYELDVATATESSSTGATLTENFTGFTAVSSYSSTSDYQTVASGTWSYENVIISPNGTANGDGSTGFAQMKAGAGILYLPTIDYPTSITVTAYASSGSLTLQQNVEDSWNDIKSWDLSSTCTTYSYTFTNTGAATQLRFVAGSKATYIHDVTVNYSSSTITYNSISGYPKSVGDVTSYAVTGLTSETQYSVRVRAVNNSGNSDWSNVASITTDAAPTAPELTASLGTSFNAYVGDKDIEFTVTATGYPEPTITASCTEGAYFIFESGEFIFPPDTEGTYHFVFTATNTVGTGNLTVTITVSKALVTVSELIIDDITATTALASWTECDGVSSYTLQLASDAQFTTGGSGAAVLETDFSDTTGWTLSGTGQYTSAPYFGAGSPAIKFDGTGDYAISPDFGSGTKLQFWAYGNGGSGSTFAISGLVNGSWQDIETVTIAQGGDTYEVILPSGTSKVRFDFTKSVNCALDDVVVYGASGSGSLIATETITDGTNYTFTNLTPYTVYYARVKGNSDWSNIASFTTDAEGVAPELTASLGTSFNAYVGDKDIEFTVTATGYPEPTITATCTEGAYFVFENGEFIFDPDTEGTYHFVFTATNDAGTDQLTVTITVSPAPVTVPTLSITEVTTTTALATWTACDNVSSYTLQLASDDQFTTGGSSSPSATQLISEDFSGFTGNGTADISSFLNDYTATTGWTGSKVYTASEMAKIGASSGQGWIMTPALNASGTLTVVWSAYRYGTSDNSTILLGISENGTDFDEETITIGDEMTKYTNTFTVSGSTVYVRWMASDSSKARFYLDDITISTGGSGSGSGSGSLIAEYTVTEGTSYTFTGLSPRTTYYARVKGDAGWSNVEEFKTIDPAIAYYQNADGKTGSELKTAMCGIIYNRTEKSYDDLWTAYQSTDVRSDGKIWDMYSNITNYDPVNGSHANSEEGSGFNREHSFPKSWFGGEVMPMYTDLHHLYPVDGNINTRRSNNPYGETNGEDYKSANDFSKLGACTYPGYTGKVFEPNDEYKGDFARTYFYMVTCYEEKLHDWYTNFSSTEVTAVIDGSTYPALQTWQLNMLMKWAKNDPVSEKERNRNNAVYAIQHNRNPFIDYPGLEEYIWGSLTTTAFDYDDYLQPARLSFSPSEATATIGEDFTEPTLTTTPANLTVTYSSSNTNVATVDASTGEVTLKAAGITTITATFAGDDDYSGGTASYTLTVSNPALVSGETLFYESLSGYSGSESSQAMSTSYQYLDYKQWNTITSVFAGANSDAHANGGCLKFGSGSAKGSMTTGNITLTGGGTLTFYLKKYGDDTGKLNVTVTGATADVTEFTPASNWTLCTVNLSNVTGNVTITLETTSKRAYVDEIKLTSNGTLDLANDDDNASIIAAAADNGSKFNVMLKNRTLYRDGNWNTLCLPFNYDLSATDSPISGNGITVMAFNESTFDNGTLTLNFTTVFDNDTYKGNLEAGTPYLIKWDEDTYNTTITDPVFYGVTIDATTHNKTCDLGGDNSIAFCGTYGQLTYEATDKSILFLGEKNTLYYPESGATIGAQRAYFQLTGLEAKASAPADGEGAGNGDSSYPIRAFVLNFGEDASSIEKVIVNTAASAWYTLDGRKLNGKPTSRGLYINNGKKVVIK